VGAPRRALQHGRRAGERLPPDDILQATSSHHMAKRNKGETEQITEGTAR
jgi:hypothetical protein